MYVLRALFSLSVATLTGCAAAPYAASYALGAAAVGYSAYGFYEISKDSTATFEIDRNDPDAASQRTIQNAKSLAIYPAMNGSDGEYVDVFRNRTDMSVISSSKTIAYLNKNKTLNLTSLPQRERVQAMARLGRANGADLTIVGIPKSTTTETGVFKPGAKIKQEIQVSLVDTKQERVLWEENQRVVIDGLQNLPTQDQIYKLIAAGASERLMDIRSGRAPEPVAQEGSFFSEFECGGKYNPICDKSSSVDK